MEWERYLTLKNLIIVLLVALLFVALGYGLSYIRKREEQYTASSLGHIGGLADYGRIPRRAPENYENFGQYNPFYPVLENTPSWNEKRTIDRLDRIDADLLPKVSTNVTPYNIDVADPVSYTFQVHAPRVIRKDRLAMEADPVRGDVPIMMYPDVPVIQRSQYNRDSLRLDGTFSEALAKSYDRLTGKSYFNQPSYVSHGGLIM